MFDIKRITYLHKCNHYEADKAYQGTVETNEANKLIAENLNKTNIQLQREANEANLNLAKQQNDWNVEQWNRQNEYNTPANQVKRLVEAGLNPNLANGLGDTGNANSSPQSADLANQGAAHVDARPDLQNPYGLAWQQARQNKFERSMQALSQLQESSGRMADIMESKQRIAESQSRIAISQGQNPYQRALLEAQRGLTQAQKEESEQRTRESMKLLMGKWKSQDMSINKLAAETRQINALADKIEAENKWIDRQMASDVARKMAEAGLADVQAQLTRKDIEWLDKSKPYEIALTIANARNAFLQGDYQEWCKGFRETNGYSPDTPLWNAVTTFTGSASNFLGNTFGKLGSSLGGFLYNLNTSLANPFFLPFK